MTAIKVCVFLINQNSDIKKLNITDDKKSYFAFYYFCGIIIIEKNK